MSVISGTFPGLKPNFRDFSGIHGDTACTVRHMKNAEICLKTPIFALFEHVLCGRLFPVSNTAYVANPSRFQQKQSISKKLPGLFRAIVSAIAIADNRAVPLQKCSGAAFNPKALIGTCRYGLFYLDIVLLSRVLAERNRLAISTCAVIAELVEVVE